MHLICPPKFCITFEIENDAYAKFGGGGGGKLGALWEICKWRIESKHECIISIWGFPEILPFAWFCFANMLRYGISSVLWAPFSLKTILEESTPAGARQVRKTVEKAGKFLSIKNHESSEIDAGL